MLHSDPVQDTHSQTQDSDRESIQNGNKKTKPHVIRRNIEDYLAEKALNRRLKEVFDEELDFALD